MSKTKGVVNVICGLLLAPIVQSEESLGDAISNGATQLDLRMRYEQVDQNAPINLDADAEQQKKKREEKIKKQENSKP